LGYLGVVWYDTVGYGNQYGMTGLGVVIGVVCGVLKYGNKYGVIGSGEVVIPCLKFTW